MLDRVDDGPLVVTDPREVIISRRYEAMLDDVVAGGDDYRQILRELRTHRNQPGGFWVAKDDPRAADELPSHPPTPRPGRVGREKAYALAAPPPTGC